MMKTINNVVYYIVENKEQKTRKLYNISLKSAMLNIKEDVIIDVIKHQEAFNNSDIVLREEAYNMFIEDMEEYSN